MEVLNNYFSKEDKIYTDYVNSTEVLNDVELNKLIKSYYETDNKMALNQIVNSFQKLIISICSDIKEKTYEAKNFELMDLVQEGNLGLVKSLNTHKENKEVGYDETKGIAPSTYFSVAISNQIKQYVYNNYYPLKVTKDHIKKLRQIRMLCAIIEQESLDLQSALIKVNKISKEKKQPLLKEQDFNKYNYKFNSLYDEIQYNDEIVPLYQTIKDDSQSIEDSYIDKYIDELLYNKLDKESYKIFLDLMDGDSPSIICKKYKITQNDLRNYKNRISKILKNDSQILSVLGKKKHDN